MIVPGRAEPTTQLESVHKSLHEELSAHFSAASKGVLPQTVAEGVSVLYFILNVLSHDMVELGGLLRELHYRTSPTMQRTAVITDAA